MKLHCLLPVLTFFLLFVPPAFAQKMPRSSENDQRFRDYLQRFPEADADKDGILSAPEARAHIAERNERREERPRRPRGPAPTETDIRYGPHERNVFDLWLPENAAGEGKSLPVFVFFHGGGFVAGDKSGFDASPYLAAGMAVVSGNYRFVDGETTFSPVPMRDCARVIQFLRYHAAKWNLDPERFAVGGSSAGAVISMWIGYRDDLADPDADDPVARQSTRVSCIAPINGPTTLDPAWITPNMGGPPHVHGALPKLFGGGVEEIAADPEMRALVLDASAMTHATKDDPPTLLVYSFELEGIPLPEDATTGLLIHHPFFGQALKEKLDELGVENSFRHGVDPRGTSLIADWVKERF